VRLELSLAAIPLASGVAEVARAVGADPASFAATAGEDFELCVCLPPAARGAIEAAWAAGDRPGSLTFVGQVVDGPAGIVFTDSQGPLVGYEHSV